jgi:PAS domain S-box-containing protein
MTVPSDTATRILVVDDRRENRIALRAVLDPLGVDVVEADSGEQALRAVLAEDFAVILLDVQMPGMDGLETAALIKQRERSRDIPIIFLTAVQADVAQVFAGYEAGAVDYLLKPFDPLVLRSKVKVFADLHHQRRELVRSDELVRNAFAAAPTGMVLCDIDGLALRVNPALERLVQRSTEQLIGTCVVDLLREQDRDALGARIRRARERETDTAPWSTQAVTPTGAHVPVAVSVNPVRDVHGETHQVLVQVADERDRRIASTLQRALLPERLPSVAGVSMAAHIAPGAGGTRVGGDWYDAVALPGGRLGVVVGDVAGHGVEAAARMGELRSVARAYALEGHGPVELVERMNGYHAGLGADLMTTMLYAVIEIDSGIARVVNAGHPPPMVVRADGTSTVVEGAGPPLGVLDTWRYQEQQAQLDPGDLAVLYTDGLVERRGERLDESLARLRVIAEASHGEAGHALMRVLEAVGADDADDDVTLVVVRAEEKLGPVARLKLSPDAEALAALRRVLRRWLDEAGAEPDEAAAIVMAANEAWQNALEHGTRFARTTVDVDCELDGDTVVLTIRDAGTRDRSPSDPDRGRGIELMRALVDDISLEIAPHGSCVRLRRALRARGRAESETRGMTDAEAGIAPRVR